MQSTLTTIATLLILSPAVTSGQDLVRDLQKVTESYTQSQALRTDVVLRTYDTRRQDTVPVRTRYARLRKQDSSYYQSFGSITFIATPERSLMIDTGTKSMTLQPRPDSRPQRSKQQKWQPGKTTKNLQKYADQSYYVDREGPLRHYRSTANSYIKRTELYIDTTNFTLDRLVYHYNEKLSGKAYRVTLDYQNYSNKASEIDDHWFDTSRYIKEEGQGYKPGETYQHYDLKIISP